MKITHNTQLYVVSRTGDVSKMTLIGLSHAFIGGLEPEHITVYTTQPEADAAGNGIRIRCRLIKVLDGLTDDQLAAAVKLLENGVPITPDQVSALEFAVKGEIVT